MIFEEVSQQTEAVTLFFFLNVERAKASMPDGLKTREGTKKGDQQGENSPFPFYPSTRDTL